MTLKLIALNILYFFSTPVQVSFSLKDYDHQILKGGDNFDPSYKCDHFTSKKFIERATTDKVIFNTQDGKINPGDITVWNNDLYNGDDEKKVGSILGHCVFLPEIVYDCSVTLRLDGGSVMMQGVYLDNPDYLAVTGGTHCYNDIVGEARVTASYLGNASKTQYKLLLKHGH